MISKRGRHQTGDSIASISCEKGGGHEGSRISMICLNPLCREDCLLCCRCFESKHSSHEVLDLEKLFSDLEERLAASQRKHQLILATDIESSKSHCLNGVASITKYFETKLSKLSSMMIRSLTDISQRNSEQFAVAAQRIYKTRMENSQPHLQASLLHLLNNSHVASGKVTALSDEFILTQGKPIDAINAQTQAFMMTLKNIYAVVSEQCAKFIDPQAQPHHVKRTKHSNDSHITAAPPQQLSSSHFISHSSSQHAFTSSSNHSQQTLTSLNNNNALPFHDPPLRRQQYNEHHDHHSTLQDLPPSPSKKQTVVFTANQKALSSISTVIPNISQLQDIQTDLFRRMQEQQNILDQLQSSLLHTKTTAAVIPPMFGVTSSSLSSSSASALTNVPPTFGMSSSSPSVSETKRQANFKQRETQSNHSMACSSYSPPPQLPSSTEQPQNRLLYYSSLFQQHAQSKSIYLKTSPSMSSFSNHSFVELRTTPSEARMPPQRVISVDCARQSSVEQDETRERMEQDLLDIDLIKPQYKELPKSSERSFKYRFHKDYRHEFLAVSDLQRSIKGTSESNEARLALLSPSVEIKPLCEHTWTFKIVNCKAVAYSTPLAVGLCLKSFAESNQYKYLGEDAAVVNTQSSSPSFTRTQEKFSSTKKSGGVLGSKASKSAATATAAEHGCYLLTSTGFIRNYSDKTQDMKRAQVRFDQGDILNFTFNPFRNYLKIKNATSGQLCMINTQFHPGDQLFPCVRISYCQDQVQIIDSSQ